MNDLSDKDFLDNWIRERMRVIRRHQPQYRPGPDGVTVLAYHFWRETGFAEAFEKIECAVHETWRHCGFMPTVLVCNRAHPSVERFAEAWSPWVSVQVESSLLPGEIYTMSADCNGKLYTRFETPSVLIVQNDGFPLRPGLERFLEKYDFIGAPYVRDIWWKRLICTILNCWASNGGFSLRSREICERVAFYWQRGYCAWPPGKKVSEDLFYTQTLPLRERDYRKRVTIADCRAAIDFSSDLILPGLLPTHPFGFHGAAAFRYLHRNGVSSDLSSEPQSAILSAT